MEDAELLERWQQEPNFEERDRLLLALTERGLFPKVREEEEFGFYPDIDDPEFVSKLFHKREFAEHKQQTIQELIEEGDNPCDSTKEFEISPVQRFISQYISPKTPYNSALLYHGVGTGKCHGIDTPILMYDGSIKKVQDICKGEYLMGDDSKPRTVLSLANGRDQLYRIQSVKGDSYVVNSEHILCLQHTCEKSITEISVRDFLQLSKKIQRDMKGYRIPIEFIEKPVDFDPYILGVWLGDGSKRDPVISSQDCVILQYLREFCKNNNAVLNFQSGYDYRISAISKKYENVFLRFLQSNNLINNKHVPDSFKINSKDIRLQVLAGLIDTDGYLTSNTYEITQKSEQLSSDIVFLARSCGLACTTRLVEKSCMYNGEKRSGTYYRTFISGDINMIPVKILRKRASERKQQKNVLRYGFTVVPLGEGDYYGFTLDGNNRYILGDFSVTHNTCAAITVAEAYLEMFPRKKVIIVAPPNIQPGFERAIFSEDRLILGEGEGEPNRFNGCTGSTYLKLSGMESSRDPKEIGGKIHRLKKKRYEIYGYTQFYNHIRGMLESIPKSIQGERRLQMENEILRKKFSGRMLIVDEAHNLRDIPGEADEDNLDAPGGAAELTESLAGKRLTPFLKRVMDSSDGLKLLLLTATPMYNSYREIIFLFDLLLRNDKKATLREEDIFNRDGTFKENGEAILGRVASVYLSFMRGENPLSFPIRLEPLNLSSVDEWPRLDPKGVPVAEEDRERMLNLPFVACPFEGEALVRYQDLARQTVEVSGLGLATVDTLIQAGNWMFPEAGGEAGFSSAFIEETRGSLKAYKAKDPSWLKEDVIATHSPKAAMLLAKLKTTRGVSFVYSRFVKSGALSIALALEANGYTLFGRETPFLINGNQQAEGRQCSQCALRERVHSGSSHSFSPAFYILLTGRDEYSPNNKVSVDTARGDANVTGKQVKVILGSQVASEGIDLRFIREVFVFDSWYHMNKLEQVIGRAIRMCSHSMLPIEERNSTINLLVTTLPEEQSQETLDMYQYRQGVRKALQVGRVTRVLKRYALDCNLNRQAILIKGLDPRRQIDGQGQIREAVNINDMPFTSICDWIETCDYTCAVPIDIKIEDTDDSTYDAYSARWRQSQLKERLRRRFEDQPFLSFENLENIMSDVPRSALASILSEVVGNRSFRVRSGIQDGYIIYKNGFYLFQPEGLQDVLLPISLRVASFPVKRDSYEPSPPIEKETPSEEMTEAESDVIPGFETFWQVFEGWSDSIHDGSADLLVPNSIKNEVKKRYGTNKKEMSRVLNSFEMIPWLYTAIRENDEYRATLSKVMCELVWDEYLKQKEQYALFKLAIDNDNVPILEVAEEHQVRSGSKDAYRSINPKTGILEYICEGVPCSPALVKVFEEDDSDPLKNLKANTEVSGAIYGTVVYKSGLFVFKTNTPVPKEMEVADKKGGRECKNVSGVTSHKRTLVEIGEMAKESIGTDLDLNTDTIENKRPFKNAPRVCTLTNLALRMLSELDDKWWFYRPIASFKSGHKGEKSA